jgi:hypothetical protein
VVELDLTALDALDRLSQPTGRIAEDQDLYRLLPAVADVQLGDTSSAYRAERVSARAMVRERGKLRRRADEAAGHIAEAVKDQS